MWNGGDWNLKKKKLKNKIYIFLVGKNVSLRFTLFQSMLGMINGQKPSKKVSWAFLLFLNTKMNGHKEDYTVQLEYAINLLSKVWQINIDWVEKICRRKIYFVFNEKFWFSAFFGYLQNQELNVRTLYHVCSAAYSSLAFLRTHEESKSSHPLPLQAITFL